MNQRKVKTEQWNLTHLRITDELAVQVSVERLNVATVYVQHRLSNNTDLQQNIHANLRGGRPMQTLSTGKQSCIPPAAVRRSSQSISTQTYQIKITIWLTSSSFCMYRGSFRSRLAFSSSREVGSMNRCRKRCKKTKKNLLLQTVKAQR